MKQANLKYIRDGALFRAVQRLKKGGIPFRSVDIRIDPPKDGVSTSKRYFLFTCDTWAAKKAMHPFEGISYSFMIWDSKRRGEAKIAIEIN